MPSNDLLNLFNTWTSRSIDYFWSDLLPILIAVAIILVVFIVLSILLTVVRYVTNRRNYAKTFLELTFPADTTKSAFATEQLYILLHTRSKRHRLLEKLLGKKKIYSLELVSTKEGGIRYIIAVAQEEADVIRRSLISFLPGIKIKEIEDYLPENIEDAVSLVELQLSGDFVLPLLDQKALGEHDPMTYLTGHMTKLAMDELLVFQLVVTPLLPSIHGRMFQRTKELKSRIYDGLNLTPILKKRRTYMPSVLQATVRAVGWILRGLFKVVISLPSLLFDPNSKSIPIFQTEQGMAKKDAENPYESELGELIKTKIDQHLFETSLRILVVGKTPQAARRRAEELIAAFRPFASSHQSFITRKTYFMSLRQQLDRLKERRLSSSFFAQNPILSSSEISDLYHFPHTKTTRTEDLIKSKSQELPAPLVLKNNLSLDVVFGKNSYGNTTSAIGLTDDDRSRHIYMIGQTGSGKSTVMYHMAKDDIAKGRGLAVVDPHGDLVEDLLAVIPESRMNDLVYFNPFDIKHPIGINLLELTPNLDDDEAELEKELVCESVISIFRRVFNKDEHSDAHRIEYVLRNTIYTAFTVKDATIFTVYDLLNDPSFQKPVVSALRDLNLQHFWKNEFGRAGNYQIVKMVSGVTAKIGRFLFSPTAKRILEQPNSTIRFDDILDSGKILLCNLAEGKVGEDTSQLLGTMIIAKIHQAAMRRARQERSIRKPFYLFIDEFQNFATSSFTKLLSGGRKFGLRITIAEQSTAQQSDRNMVNVILANTGTVVCFRTASPIDEELMLAQFAPLIKQGDIGNLPRYSFYMRLAATEPTDPFSGQTLPIDAPKDDAKVGKLLEASRRNHAIIYQKPVPKEPIAEAKPKAKKALQLPEKGLGSLS